LLSNLRILIAGQGCVETPGLEQLVENANGSIVWHKPVCQLLSINCRMVPVAIAIKT
jgi:hypothetical protein